MCVGFDLCKHTYTFGVCSLSYNQIGDAGAIAIGEGVKASQTLTVLQSVLNTAFGVFAHVCSC